MPERFATAVDLTPLHAAMTAAITQVAPGLHPRLATALAVAATETAVQQLGTDRCTHHVDTCRTHHHTPVNGCPWCTQAAETAAAQADRIETKEQL